MLLIICNIHILRIYFTDRFVIYGERIWVPAGTAAVPGGWWWLVGTATSERGSEGGVARARSLSPRQLAYYDVALHEAAAALLLPFPVRRRTRERQLPPHPPCTFPSFAFRVGVAPPRLGLSLHPLARSQRYTVRRTRTRTVQKPPVPSTSAWPASVSLSFSSTSAWPASLVRSSCSVSSPRP